MCLRGACFSWRWISEKYAGKYITLRRPDSTLLRTVISCSPLRSRHGPSSQRELFSFPLVEAPEKVCLPNRVQIHRLRASDTEKLKLASVCSIGRKCVEKRLRRNALGLGQERLQ